MYDAESLTASSSDGENTSRQKRSPLRSLLAALTRQDLLELPHGQQIMVLPISCA